MHDEIPRCSRSLLTPGPQPPLSHLGVTLLRHVVATGLRYSFYQLGMPLPEAPPVRILQLRLFLDRRLLADVLGDRAGTSELIGALLDPGGSGTLPRAARPVRVAAALHRARLRAFGLRWRRTARAWPRARDRTASAQLRERFDAMLGDALPRLADAVLAEIVTVLERRRRREQGRPAPPAPSREAWRLRRGRRPRLARLGHPDPLFPSWSGAPEGAMSPPSLEKGSTRPRPTLRGTFRETYRSFLSASRPVLLALGESAVERRLLEEPEDLFFLPLEVLGDLDRAGPAGWIAAAVAANRSEHDARLREPEYADELRGGETPEGRDRSAEWVLAPLRPLP